MCFTQHIPLSVFSWVSEVRSDNALTVTLSCNLHIQRPSVGTSSLMNKLLHRPFTYMPLC